MGKCYVKTLIACPGGELEDLLGYEAGEVLEVSFAADIGWWRGTSLHTMKAGYFDQTNVEVIGEAEAYRLLQEPPAQNPEMEDGQPSLDPTVELLVEQLTAQLASEGIELPGDAWLPADENEDQQPPVEVREQQEQEQQPPVAKQPPQGDQEKSDSRKGLKNSPDIRQSLVSILFAIDLELELLKDACEMKVGNMARSKSLPEKLDNIAPKPNSPKPVKPLPPVPGVPAFTGGKPPQAPVPFPRPSSSPSPSTTTTATSPSSSAAPPVPPKSLKPTHSSLPIIALSSGETTPPPQQPQEPPVPMPRVKRSVTFNENMATELQESKLQERASYLSEKKRELTATLRGLDPTSAYGEERPYSPQKRVDRARKAVAFLCEEDLLATLPQEDQPRGGSFDEEHKKGWTYLSKKKPGEQQTKPLRIMVSY